MWTQHRSVHHLLLCSRWEKLQFVCSPRTRPGMGGTIDKKPIGGQIFAEGGWSAGEGSGGRNADRLRLHQRKRTPERRGGIGRLVAEVVESLFVASTCSVKYKARSLHLEGATPKCYKCFSLISGTMGIKIFSFVVSIFL